MNNKYFLPLCYTYKEGCAGGIAIDKQIFEDMVLQLRACEHNPRFRERAVILGAENGVITRLFVDAEGGSFPYYFRPAKESLEHVIRFWARRKIKFVGLVHTHRNSLQLSREDLAFVRQFLTMNVNMEWFYLGVLVVGGRLAVYKFERDFLSYKEEEDE